MKHALARAIAAQDVRKQDMEVEPIILYDDAAARRAQDGHVWKQRLSASKVNGYLKIDDSACSQNLSLTSAPIRTALFFLCVGGTVGPHVWSSIAVRLPFPLGENLGCYVRLWRVFWCFCIQLLSREQCKRRNKALERILLFF